VPGIGKKTAGRIILELKGKIEKGWEGEMIPSGITQADSDAIAALTALGYSVREASQALSSIQVTEGMPIEDKIRLALQQLAKR
jgi:Holliday junction DNA helicase RuvA